MGSILDSLKRILRRRTGGARVGRRIGLGRSESGVRALLDAIDDAIFIQDIDTGAILAVNRRMCDMYGYSEDEALALTVADLSEGVPPYYLEEAVLWLMKAALGGPQLFEWHARRKDGGLFWVEISVRRVDLGGPAERLLVVARDIGARKRAEQELLKHKELLEAQVQLRTAELLLAREEADRANQAKSTFLANMSHEIRTPMTAIIGLTHLAQYADPTPAQLEYLGKIRRSSEHLLSIVDDILDFSKIEAGRVDIQRTAFRPETVMRQVVEQIEERAADKGLLLALDIDPALPSWLLGDPVRLAQVLLNLAGNAVKFTERGQVAVGASPLVADDGTLRVRFTVADTGIGLDPAQAARLFQSFEQADASTSRKYGGSGLGLAICKRLVDMMGGRIGVEGSPGVGASFHVDLDLVTAEAPAEAAELPPPKLPEAPYLAGAQVLVAEDNEVNQEIARDLLEEAGVVVTLASNGREAIEHLCRRTFDCVLMDMQMPDMDGIEATRRIRGDPTLRQVPIVAMTANVAREDREACLAVGMNDFLAKPFSPEKLYAVLARAVPACRGDVAAPAPLLDAGALRRTFGEDQARAEKYVGRFVETAQASLAELEAVIERQEGPGVRFVAHRLKSSARAIGATRFAEICETLERLPDPGFDAARAMLVVMRNELVQISARIGSHAKMAAVNHSPDLPP